MNGVDVLLLAGVVILGFAVRGLWNAVEQLREAMRLLARELKLPPEDWL